MKLVKKKEGKPTIRPKHDRFTIPNEPYGILKNYTESNL
jgi:hypothetical protein